MAQPVPAAEPVPNVPYLYPNGHLGHLTPGQSTTFAQFKVLCTEKGVYKSRGEDGLPSTDDATLLRFLRARKFLAGPAYEQFARAAQWRADNAVDDLFHGVDIEDFEKTRRLYPQWTGRMDRRGMPVFLSEIGPLNLKAIGDSPQTAKRLATIRATMIKPTASATSTSTSAPTPSSKMLLLYTLYECLGQFISPWASSVPTRPYYPTPVTQSSNIFDVSGVGMKQFWDLKNHLQESSEMATAYYPETLGNIFIIGAPPFFPTAWSWIKKWFDPVVVSKMHLIAPSDVFSTLSAHIEPRNIPKKYGGTLDYAFGDMPVLDPELVRGFTWADGVGRLPPGPVMWEEAEDGAMRMVAVGSEAGVRRRQVVGTLERKYREVFYPQDHGPRSEPGEPGEPGAT